MGTTQPIRKTSDLIDFTSYYRDTNFNLRNYTLIQFALHTALRISDILHLRWCDVYDFNSDSYKNHLTVKERKTEKQNIVALSDSTIELLDAYKRTRNVTGEDFIFTKSTDYGKPLSRSQAFRVVKKAVNETIGIPDISCHSLRKTFGYYAWKQGTPPALLMEIYNHSSYTVTKRYLGIEQDEKDDVFLNMHFS